MFTGKVQKVDTADFHECETPDISVSLRKDRRTCQDGMTGNFRDMEMKHRGGNRLNVAKDVHQ